MGIIHISITTGAATSQSYRASFTVSPIGRLVPADILEGLLHQQKIILKNEQSFCTRLFRWWPMWMMPFVVREGLTSDVEFEAEFCLSCFGPVPHRFLANAPDDLRRLRHVEIALPVFVDEWFVFCHPETERQKWTDFKQLIAEPDRGFVQHPRDQADGFFQ